MPSVLPAASGVAAVGLDQASRTLVVITITDLLERRRLLFDSSADRLPDQQFVILRQIVDLDRMSGRQPAADILLTDTLYKASAQSSLGTTNVAC